MTRVRDNVTRVREYETCEREGDTCGRECDTCERECDTCERDEKSIQSFKGKTKGNRPLGGHKRVYVIIKLKWGLNK